MVEMSYSMALMIMGDSGPPAGRSWSSQSCFSLRHGRLPYVDGLGRSGPENCGYLL